MSERASGPGREQSPEPSHRRAPAAPAAGCPAADRLLDFTAGRLEGAAATAIEEHIDGCAACREALSSLARDAPSTESFGRYQLETVLGSGGMGIVYRAWDPQLGRPLAIKVVRHAEGGDAERARLVREAQSLARLSHANVCRVYDVGAEGDEVWLAMELLDGVGLRQHAAAHGAPQELLPLLLGAAEGLAAAHAADIIHRDVKPENVIVTRDGRAVVTDFGLARVEVPLDLAASTLRLEPRLTATGVIAGTPAYLAPEQLAGEPLDARVDQFAWSLMAWELLTGARPFPVSPAERLAAIRSGVRAAAALPRGVAEALMRGMAAAPADRFPSMRALIDALRAKPRRRRRAKRRGALRPWVVAAVAAALAVAATLGAWQLLRRPPAQVPPAAPAPSGAPRPTVEPIEPSDPAP